MKNKIKTLVGKLHAHYYGDELAVNIEEALMNNWTKNLETLEGIGNIENYFVGISLLDSQRRFGGKLPLYLYFLGLAKEDKEKGNLDELAYKNLKSYVQYKLTGNHTDLDYLY